MKNIRILAGLALAFTVVAHPTTAEAGYWHFGDGVVIEPTDGSGTTWENLQDRFHDRGDSDDDDDDQSGDSSGDDGSGSTTTRTAAEGCRTAPSSAWDAWLQWLGAPVSCR